MTARPRPFGAIPAAGSDGGVAAVRTEPGHDIDRLNRKVARERASRLEAERLLEEKSRELFDVNLSLRELNEDLEHIVRERTAALEKSLAKINEQHRAAEHAAQHDPLTGLPNRRHLKLHLAGLTGREAAQTGVSAIFYVDLDRFKNINDTLGHAAGDELLKVVAMRLVESAPRDAFVARYGGDEFILAVSGLADEAAATALGQRLVAEIPRPVWFDGNILRFGASVGVAILGADGMDDSALLMEADLALYRAKGAGRGCAVTFSAEMRAESRRRRQLSDDLEAALEQDQIRPVYQPRICARSGAILCLEALARWDHPTLGRIAPADFLDIAEDVGRVQDIDGRILDCAKTDFDGWTATGITVPKISVNVSVRRLMQGDLLDHVSALGFARGTLSFELLETVFLDDPDPEMMHRIAAIRALGIGVEIDDFGSGHASINGLLTIRPDALKIDRHLLHRGIEEDARADLLGAIVAIGRALRIAVVAEGIETRAQIALCQRIGCDQLQGFAISKPLEAARMAVFLRSDPDARFLPRPT